MLPSHALCSAIILPSKMACERQKLGPVYAEKRCHV